MIQPLFFVVDLFKPHQATSDIQISHQLSTSSQSIPDYPMIIMLILAPLLLLLSFFSPLIEATSQDEKGKWSLLNFQRTILENNACKYHFNISETTGPAAVDNATRCVFSIQASPGYPSCKEVGFSDVLCPNAPQYHINGGWDPVLKFITLTVNNLNISQNAYFSYTEAEMEDAKVTPLKESIARTIGTFGPPRMRKSKRGGRGTISGPAKRDTSAPVFTAEQWSLKNVYRWVRGNKSPNTMHMFTEIYNGTTSVGWCQIYKVANPDTQPEEMSFAHSPCDPLGWYLSWGYSKEKDSVVLTLMDPEKKKMTWFGWDWVNNSTVLADVGPSNVTTCC